MSADHAICLVVTYDGEAFAGFARQPEQRTVQGELERAIGEMNGAPVDTRGAGRTDAGVHAIGQRVAFDPERTIPPTGWVAGLNRTLPPDLAVTGADLRVRGYNPRFDAVDKTYRYVLQIAEHRDPLWRGRAWLIAPSRQHRDGGLDLAAMRDAAGRLVGTHDFRAFRAADDDREMTTRTILRIDLIERWAGEPTLVAIEVTGTAFMKNMVRIVVGTLLEVGRGKKTPDQVAALLGPEGRREDGGSTAPAHGLTLVEVRLGRGELRSDVTSP
jgi:tRNA pseudouridine38-40 synthase